MYVTADPIIWKILLKYCKKQLWIEQLDQAYVK